MIKSICIFLFLFQAMALFGQTKAVVQCYFSFQYNHTLYDETMSNNQSGFGFGLEVNGNFKSRWQPVVQVNTNLFVGNKLGYLDELGNNIDAKDGVTTIFGGTRLQINPTLFAALTAGVGLYNGRSHPGFRPLLGTYLARSKKTAVHLSFTSLLENEKSSDQDFGYLSLGLAVKLF